MKKIALLVLALVVCLVVTSCGRVLGELNKIINSDFINEEFESNESSETNFEDKSQEDFKTPIDFSALDRLLLTNDLSEFRVFSDGSAHYCKENSDGTFTVFRYNVSTGESAMICDKLLSNAYTFVEKDLYFCENDSYDYSRAYHGGCTLYRVRENSNSQEAVGHYDIEALSVFTCEGNILLFGWNAFNACEWLLEDMYECLISTSGDLLEDVRVTENRIGFPMGFAVSGYIAISNEKDSYGTMPYYEGIGVFGLNGSNSVVIDTHQTEIATLSGDWLYFTNGTGSQSAYVPINYLSRYNIKTGAQEALNVPLSSDGRILVDITAAIDDTLYLSYAIADSQLSDYTYLYRYNFINNELLQIEGDSNVFADNSSALKSVSVSANGGLRIRSGPGVEYDKVGLIPDGSIITVYEERNGWYRTIYNGTEGWVSAKYCS